VIFKLTGIEQSFFVNRIRLILKPRKDPYNLNNSILCSFENLQFVKVFLTYDITTIINPYYSAPLKKFDFQNFFEFFIYSPL